MKFFVNANVKMFQVILTMNCKLQLIQIALITTFLQLWIILKLDSYFKKFCWLTLLYNSKSQNYPNFECIGKFNFYSQFFSAFSVDCILTQPLLKYINIFRSSIMWIIPLKTLYDLNFECILMNFGIICFDLVRSFVLSLLSFCVIFYLQHFEALELVVIIFVCHVVSVFRAFIEMIFFHENVVTLLKERKRQWEKPIKRKLLLVWMKNILKENIPLEENFFRICCFEWHLIHNFLLFLLLYKITF